MQFPFTFPLCVPLNHGRALQRCILEDFRGLPRLVHLILTVVDSPTIDAQRHRLESWRKSLIAVLKAFQGDIYDGPVGNHYPRYIPVCPWMLSLRIAESSALNSGERGKFCSYVRIRGREKEDAVMMLERMERSFEQGLDQTRTVHYPLYYS